MCSVAEPSGSTATDANAVERGRDSRDEPSAADRHDDHVDVRHVLRISSPTVPWPAMHLRVVEGMDEHAAALLLQLRQPLEDLVRARRLLVDRRPVALGGRALDRARALPHDDEAVDPLACGGPGERSRVVPGRGRDDAAGALLRRQRRELRQARRAA